MGSLTSEVNRQTWTLGNWNAYVQQGGDREDCRRRLKEVPEMYFKNVQRNIKTVFAIRGFRERQGKRGLR